MRFDFERPRNDVSERGGIAAKDSVKVFFEKSEKFGISNDSLLDHFGETAAVLTFGQRLQHR